jgi:hypothetical protein
MRLIDADKLLLKFNKVYDEADAKYHESDFDSFWGGGCSMIQEVIKETAEQPTAYDVDDIVAKLEEIKNGHEKNICVYCAMDKAIEIVKAGGLGR